jgi:hypothetical protein
MDAEQQKAWMEYITPGKYHEMMAKTAGEWKAVIKMWMDPSAEPQLSEGTTVNEMIMGGRYLKSTQSAMMMGMPFEGFAIEGYDNGKKEFVSIWIDNMGTGIMLSSGAYDETSKTIILKGSMPDPTGVNVEYRQVTKIIDDNKYISEMFTNYGSGEFKMMEIEYTRKQK